MKPLFFLLSLIVLSTTTYVGAQNNKSQNEKFETIYNASKVLVKTQTYQFVGNLVYNGKKREKLEPHLNTISINTSDISGKLLALSDINAAFDINGKIKKYKVAFDDTNQQIAITFKVNGNSIEININPNGQASVTYNLKGASDMIWMGKLENFRDF